MRKEKRLCSHDMPSAVEKRHNCGLRLSRVKRRYGTPRASPEPALRYEGAGVAVSAFSSSLVTANRDVPSPEPTFLNARLKMASYVCTDAGR